MSDLNTLTAVEIETGPNPSHTIIWLHGLGADGNDFVPIIDALKITAKKPLRFVFPHAPERPVTLNGGYVMRAWYDLYGTDFGAVEDETGIHQSQAAIDALIDNELQRGIPSTRIVLAGFSQGGAMALQTGLRQRHQLGGIMALSCYLPLASSLQDEATDENASIPIFMAHGAYDAVVPIALATESRIRLEQAHYTAEWHEYDIEHSVSAEEIDDIDAWLRRNLI